MFTLKGRTMIITGGAGNNGLAIICGALEAGMNVAFMSGWHSKAQDAIKKLDPKYKDHVVGYAQNPQSDFGKDKNLADTDKEFWHHSMYVPEGVFFNTKLALPYLLKSKCPRVINLTTCDGRNGGYCFNPSFAAARGALISLTNEMAKELGPMGITVNSVILGHIEDDVPNEDKLPDWEREELLRRTPVGRLQAEGAVAPVLFLASEEAGFVNGACIDVNGGMIVG